MAAAASSIPQVGGRSLVTQAAQVCILCKARKKKCDKALPSCGYCIEKRLHCAYSTPHARRATRSRSPLPESGTDSSQLSPSSPLVRVPHVTPTAASLHLEVHRLIRSTGQFVDDVTACYFQGLHRYLPIISRTRFHNSLITQGATPSAAFSVLLLALCVLVSSPALGHAHRDAHSASSISLDRRQLHLTAKSLLAQVQATSPVSVHLIQAALLLSLYEYAEGRPDDALATIASCARMAYTARIHVREAPTFLSTPPLTPSNDSGIGTPASEDTTTHTDAWIESEEAANTWWGIVICERKYICDASVPEQPLITTFPGADARLPTESKVLESHHSSFPDPLPYVPVYSTEYAHIKAFGRAAQATWYLEQILKSLSVSAMDIRLDQLKKVDIDLQKFLGTLMLQCHSGTQISCEALTIAIRAFFALHTHIIGLQVEPDGMMDCTMEELIGCSYTALDTGVKMVLDIVECINQPHMPMFHAIAPSYLYIVRAALRFIAQRGTSCEEDGWIRSAEARLQRSVEYFV